MQSRIGASGPAKRLQRFPHLIVALRHTSDVVAGAFALRPALCPVTWSADWFACRGDISKVGRLPADFTEHHVPSVSSLRPHNLERRPADRFALGGFGVAVTAPRYVRLIQIPRTACYPVRSISMHVKDQVDPQRPHQHPGIAERSVGVPCLFCRTSVLIPNIDRLTAAVY